MGDVEPAGEFDGGVEKNEDDEENEGDERDEVSGWAAGCSCAAGSLVERNLGLWGRLWLFWW